jgi:hypothetical protein
MIANNTIENHFVKDELLEMALLPSVAAALGEAHKETAVDVAAVIALGANCKLQVKPPRPECLQPLFMRIIRS